MPTASVDVTVVVPTHDRPEALRRCLRAIAAQEFPGTFEVVVSDDASRDSVAVEGAVHEAGARLERSEHLGVCAARNRGAHAARGRYVCFTDDDCEPFPDWLAQLVARLEAGAAAVTGRTINARRDDALAEATQVLANAFLDDRASRATFAPASNFGCRADVMDAVPFDDGFARLGAEDRDWHHRVTVAGHEIELVESARVLHHPELSLGEFWRKQVKYGRGAYEFRRRHSLRPEPPLFYARLIRTGFRHGFRVGASVSLAQLATATGVVAQAVSSR